METIVSRSRLPTVPGEPAAAGGLRMGGIRKNGTLWPRDLVAKRLAACWFWIGCGTNGGWRRSMTDRCSPVPNTRSPGTPVCYPNDAYEPPALQESTSVSRRRQSTAIAHDSEYVELHATSAFSFLAGASQPEALIERAAELDMPAIALADRNGLYGVARFHTAAKRLGVQAHIGAEIAFSAFGQKLQPPAWLPHRSSAEPSRLVLLCTSQTGYQNLCQLITRFKMREVTKSEGATTLEDLEEFSAGLICLTGGDEGPLSSALARRGGEREARKVAERLTRS